MKSSWKGTKHSHDFFPHEDLRNQATRFRSASRSRFTAQRISTSIVCCFGYFRLLLAGRVRTPRRRIMYFGGSVAVPSTERLFSSPRFVPSTHVLVLEPTSKRRAPTGKEGYRTRRRSISKYATILAMSVYGVAFVPVVDQKRPSFHYYRQLCNVQRQVNTFEEVGRYNLECTLCFVLPLH